MLDLKDLPVKKSTEYDTKVRYIPETCLTSCLPIRKMSYNLTPRLSDCKSKIAGCI